MKEFKVLQGNEAEEMDLWGEFNYKRERERARRKTGNMSVIVSCNGL